MASYEIEVSATAKKALRKLDREHQVRVLQAIQQLANDPRPRGCRKLRGYDDVFRIRTGRFRIIYSIESRRLLVIVLKIGQRKDVYR